MSRLENEVTSFIEGLLTKLLSLDNGPSSHHFLTAVMISESSKQIYITIVIGSDEAQKAWRKLDNFRPVIREDSSWEQTNHRLDWDLFVILAAWAKQRGYRLAMKTSPFNRFGWTSQYEKD